MQAMTVNGVDIPFSYDGVQLFLSHHLPTAKEVATMQLLVITSTKQWCPCGDLMHHLCSSDPSPKVIVVCHRPVSKDAIEKRQHNLVLLHIRLSSRLSNTTQLTPSVVTNNQDVAQWHLVSHLLQL
jgi:hypothetical protein